MDFQVYPWGNAYYATEACGKGPYDPDERHCWVQRCIQASPAPDDCFPADGEVVAQHGPEERDVDILEACAATQNPDWHTSWPYIHCMETKYEQEGTKASHACAEHAKIDGDRIEACAKGPEGLAAEVAMAKATPDHAGVPFLLVNGASVDGDGPSLLKAICEAFTGEKPEGCLKGAIFANEAPSEILI